MSDDQVLMGADALTPALLDLMEHEQAIEQRLVDIGWHLRRIRDGKKYRAAGFRTFEDYCSNRWQLTRRTVNRHIAAAETVSQIEAELETNDDLVLEHGLGPMGPKKLNLSERAVRPLTSLPTPREKAAAYLDAVQMSSSSNPTAKDMKEAVDRQKERTSSTPKPETSPTADTPPPSVKHPASFPDEILEVIAEHVAGLSVVVDPFAGIGKIHRLREIAGVRMTLGIELEQEWADCHQDTVHASACDLEEILASRGVRPDAIVTSPTYGNRMADHHDAKDDSKRLTYRHQLGRPLSEGNSGAMQWGEAYRQFHLGIWQQVHSVLPAGGLFLINIKDHIRNGQIQHVSAWHVDTLTRRVGFKLTAMHSLPTRGMAFGKHHDKRTNCEQVFVFTKIGGMA